MDKQDTVAKKTADVQELVVRGCELRLERRTRDAYGNERVEFVCGASGGTEQGHVLGVAGEDCSSMRANCNSCPIPDALESRRSCLNLVPVRRFTGRTLPMIQLGTQGDQGRNSRVTTQCAWVVPTGFLDLHANSFPVTGPKHNGCCAS